MDELINYRERAKTAAGVAGAGPRFPEAEEEEL